MTKQIKFYTKDQDGNKTFIDIDQNKIYAEFSSGENLSIEIPTQGRKDDVILHSWTGDGLGCERPKAGEKFILTNIIIHPMCGSVLGISLETMEDVFREQCNE